MRRGDHCPILEGDETPTIEEETAARDDMDLLGWLRKQIAEADTQAAALRYVRAPLGSLRS